MKDFLIRNRHEVSLLLGFALLFLFLGYGKGETTWLDWTEFAVAVVLLTSLCSRFVLPLSVTALYAPLAAWWIFWIGYNVFDYTPSSMKFSITGLAITCGVWAATYFILKLTNRSK